MENDTLQRRSAATVKTMGVNSYSQIVSAFRAQGDLTNDKASLLPVLQNALGISRERHTAEVKRALYDEQLSEIASSVNPQSATANWQAEANYACPTVVHRPPNNKLVQFAEHILQTTAPTAIIQHPQPNATTHLSNELKQLLHDESKHDGITNATQQLLSSATKPNVPNFNPTEINGSKVIRLVRAKQGTKRKSSLDTLIEVVQKELRRVDEQATSMSPLSSPPYATHSRSVSTPKHQQNRLFQSTLPRSIITSVLPSSHPGSLTSQSNQSFKIARKRGTMNFNHSKPTLSSRQRNSSFNNDDESDFMEHDALEQYSLMHPADDGPAGEENIDDIVRDTVDRLVAITLLNSAPFVVSMLTPVPGSGTTTDFKGSTSNMGGNTISTVKPSSFASSAVPKSDYYRHVPSPRAMDVRNSMLQTSPIKPSVQHHSQLIIQPATSTKALSTNQGTTTPTLFVAPRILNFQTVVPKPTTNIQIGNTKIILVSPSNITQHLPHTTSSTVGNPNPTASSLLGNSPMKLMALTTSSPTNPIGKRSTPLPINCTPTSTLTLPKNVQIVIPSQTPSTIQLTRTHGDETNRSVSIAPTTAFRPVNTLPITLTACPVDQIPQANQEVTVTTSPATSPPLFNSTASDPSLQTSLAVATPETTNAMSNVRGTMRASPTQDETLRPMAINFQPQTHALPRPALAHGPMIYRMTSVNPNVPVFRVRTATAPTSTATTTATVMNKIIKTDAKPLSMASATSMCYEPKPSPTSTPASGSVSVLACFKTTKKRNKERAIMPRPSATDSNEASSHTIPSATNAPLILPGDVSFVSSADYRSQLSTPTRLIQQTNVPSNLWDDPTSAYLSLSSMHEQTNDSTTSSTNSIPVQRSISTQSYGQSNSFRTIASPSPSSRTQSPSISPIDSLHSASMTKASTEGKLTQGISHDDDENSMEREMADNEPIPTGERVEFDGSRMQKRKSDGQDDDSWTTDAESLLGNILAQDDFRSLDERYQQQLSSKVDLIRADLAAGAIPSKDDFSRCVLDMKRQLIDEGSPERSNDQLDKGFQCVETELAKFHEQKRMRTPETAKD